MKKVTVLIPCFNEEASLPFLYEALRTLAAGCDGYEWEYLFVNDGSDDRTLDVIRRMREGDGRVCYVDLSRNFGKEAAMLAGFDYAGGDCTVIIDADLQHPPALIPEMLALWEEGYDDVYAKRRSRGKESWLRRKLSLAFYSLLQHTTRIEILPDVGDFRLLDRRCIDALRNLRETERYTKGMYCWIGFRKKEIRFDQNDRVAGQSSWKMLKLLKLAVEGITSYTTAPLRISSVVGFVFSIIAFFYMMYILVRTMLYGDPVQGFPTLIIIILFLGGIQLLSIGIIGEYIGRIFNETKRRPAYIVREYKK